MSKRRVERDLEALEDDVLRELSDADRLGLVLEAMAADNEDRLTTLTESIPRVDARVPDPAYGRRYDWAIWFGQAALYELHTAFLQLRRLELQQYAEMLVLTAFDEPPTDESVRMAAVRPALLETCFVRLYVNYHVYQRFATEVLGVELETWLAIHPDGPAVLADVRTVLDNEALVEAIDAKVRIDEETASGLETLVARHYERVVDGWDDFLFPRYDLSSLRFAG